MSADLSHTAAADTGIDGGLRTAGSDKHNYCSHSRTAHMDGLVTHARCCLLMLMGGSVVTPCSLHVLLSTRGICPVGRALVIESNKKTNFTSTYDKIGLIQGNPGNRLIYSQRKKTLRARHASYNSARIYRYVRTK